MRYLLFSVLLIVLFSGCKSKKESSEFFKRGNFHFKKNEFDKSEHFFNEAIKKDKNFADAYNNRGAVYLIKGDLNKAVQDFEKAVEIDQKFSDAKFNLARVYSESGKYTKAEVIFKDLEPQMKNSSEYHNYFGQNHIGQNHWDQGKISFIYAIKIKPDDIKALTNLGYVYLMEGDIQKASEYLDKALKINAEFIFALNNKAVIEGRKRDFGSAIKYLEKALRKEPQNQIFLNNMALMQYEIGNLIEADDLVRRSEIINAQDFYLQRNKAISLLKKGKSAESKNILLKLENEHPDTEYIYYYLYLIFQKEGDQKQACKYLNTGKKIGDRWCIDLSSACN